MRFASPSIGPSISPSMVWITWNQPGIGVLTCHIQPSRRFAGLRQAIGCLTGSLLGQARSLLGTGEAVIGGLARSFCSLDLAGNEPAASGKLGWLALKPGEFSFEAPRRPSCSPRESRARPARSSHAACSLPDGRKPLFSRVAGRREARQRVPRGIFALAHSARPRFLRLQCRRVFRRTHGKSRSGRDAPPLPRTVIRRDRWRGSRGEGERLRAGGAPPRCGASPRWSAAFASSRCGVHAATVSRATASASCASRMARKITVERLAGGFAFDPGLAGLTLEFIEAICVRQDDGRRHWVRRHGPRNPSQRQRSPSRLTRRWPGFNCPCSVSPTSRAQMPIWRRRRCSGTGAFTTEISGLTPAAAVTVPPPAPARSNAGAHPIRWRHRGFAQGQPLVLSQLAGFDDN